MVTSKLFVGLAALALVSSGALAGCASETDSAEGAVDESADDLTAAGKALIGSYSDDAGAFKTLDLTATKVGQRNVFTADVDTGIRCITTPCPSSEHIEGTFTAGAKTITLSSTTATVHSQHLLGKYDYVVQGDKLTLSRKDFSQSLSKDAGIWPATATKLVASVSGGFIAPPPAGSTCSNGAEYTLVAATKKLSWKICEFDGANPRHYKTGTITLSATKLAAVASVLNGLQVATQHNCGADKPFESFVVTTPAGDKHYTDSFYACNGGSDVYVDDIGSVFDALRTASGN